MSLAYDTYYCRGCNKEFSEAAHTEEHHIGPDGKRHPRVDCDLVEKAGKKD